jgi:hypothetical protein
MPDPETQRLDYQETMATYRQLVDVRFKLLAFVPTLTGAAVALMSATDLPNVEQLALSLLGLFVTLGLVMYDQRNTQLHDGSVGRAEHLEAELQLPKFGSDKRPGLMGSRRGPRRRLFGIPVRHDPGLWLVYASAAGAWVFAAIESVPEISEYALATGVAVAIILFTGMATTRVPAEAKEAANGTPANGSRSDIDTST